MTTPARYTNGFTQDAIWQPLGKVGIPNPGFYHQTFDDFDFFDTNEWTTISASTGNIASAAGDGGLAVLTTAATNNDFEGFQRKVAGFTFSPPNGTTVAGKKLLFLTRISLSSILSGFVAGLMNTTTTPMAPTDGLYVIKLPNATAINLVSMVGSVPTSVAIPPAAYAFLANAVAFDVGVFYDPSNGTGIGPTMVAMFGQNLIGYAPQSGSGAGNAAGNPPRQPVISFVSVNGTTPTPTTANLNPTVAVQAPSAGVVTATVDLLLACKER